MANEYINKVNKARKSDELKHQIFRTYKRFRYIIICVAFFRTSLSYHACGRFAVVNARRVFTRNSKAGFVFRDMYQ